MINGKPAGDNSVSVFARDIQILNEHEFYSTLAETPGPSIVFFTKPGCSSCQLWKRLLAELLQLRNDVHVFQVDAEQNMALSHEYELFHLPAIFLFVDGDYHCELQSEARLTNLQNALQLALQSPAEEAP